MLSAVNLLSSRNSCKHNTSTCSCRIISATAAAVMDLGPSWRNPLTLSVAMRMSCDPSDTLKSGSWIMDET